MGPDNVPYEVLKEIAPQISKGLVQAFTKQLASGTLPRSFKDSITTAEGFSNETPPYKSKYHGDCKWDMEPKCK